MEIPGTDKVSGIFFWYFKTVILPLIFGNTYSTHERCNKTRMRTGFYKTPQTF